MRRGHRGSMASGWEGVQECHGIGVGGAQGSCGIQLGCFGGDHLQHIMKVGTQGVDHKHAGIPAQ